MISQGPAKLPTTLHLIANVVNKLSCIQATNYHMHKELQAISRKYQTENWFKKKLLENLAPFIAEHGLQTDQNLKHVHVI